MTHHIIPCIPPGTETGSVPPLIPLPICELCQLNRHVADVAIVGAIARSARVVICRLCKCLTLSLTTPLPASLNVILSPCFNPGCNTRFVDMLVHIMVNILQRYIAWSLSVPDRTMHRRQQ